MKIWSMILAVLFLTFLTASVPSRQGLQPGTVAPELVIASGDKAVSLDDFKGKYVLLNFWDSADPESRVRNARYAAVSGNGNDDRLALVSVCTDSDEALCKSIIKVDNLDGTSQYFSSDLADAAKTADAFGTGNQNRSYLISPQGVIVDVNPSIESLKNLI